MESKYYMIVLCQDAVDYANEILSCFPKHIKCPQYIKKRDEFLLVLLKEKYLVYDKIVLVGSLDIEDRMVNVRDISGQLVSYVFDDFNEMMNASA